MMRRDDAGDHGRNPLGVRSAAAVALGAAFGLTCGAPAPAAAQSVIVAVDSTRSTPLAANFSGGNIASPDTPVELTDPAVQGFVRPLQSGVVRWPGGKVDDFFIWETGLIPPPAGTPTSKARPGTPTPIDILSSVFAPYPTLSFNGEIARTTAMRQPILAGKGGNPLDAFNGFAQAIGARFVVVVNATTDTVASIERLANTVAQRRLPVVAFELVNEPYFIVVPSSAGPVTLPPGSPRVPGAYTDGGDYLAKMKPYRDAIKRGFQAAGVDPSHAVVAISGGYAAETASYNTSWAAALSAYTYAHGAWWDGVVYHFYPPQANGGAFSEKMIYANDALVIGTDPFIATYRTTNFSAKQPLFITEYDVTLSDTGIEGTVYAGLFCAEYIARMSRFPETADVMLHELFSSSDGVGVPNTAIDGTGDWHQKLTAAGQAGQILDTTGRIQGIYDTAQILGEGIANAAVNNSDAVLNTAVAGATGTVPTRTGTMPAVFAQAYHGRDGQLHVVATNKGRAPVSMSFVVGGRPVVTPLTIDRLAPTDADPAQVNTAASQPVAVVHGTARGSVTLPGYSASHVVFAAP